MTAATAGEAGGESVAAFLNRVCNATVVAARAENPAIRAALAQQLEHQAASLGADSEVGTFCRALAALLGGVPPEEAAAGLTGVFHEGLLAVAEDMAAEEEPDWIAALAAQVATILKQRDRAAAGELAERLQQVIAGAGTDAAAAAYLQVLLGVLAGADVRRQALALREPYRSAYFSLQAVVRGVDPRAGLIERLRHNAMQVLAGGNPEARRALATAMARVRVHAGHGGDAELERFVAALALRLDGEPAQADFADPVLREAWAAIDAAGGNHRR